MSRCRCFVLALGTLVSLVGTVRAQQPAVDGTYFASAAPPAAAAPPKENWWQRWKRDYHRNQCWPEPFVAGDRAAVVVPFEIMADNAWRRQNLLCEYHFVEGTSELNDAGLYRVAWVMSKAPTQRRQLYVDRMMSDKATADRIIAVRKAAIRMDPYGPPIPVYSSNLGPGNWSGESAEAVINAQNKTWPEPRLPTATRAPIN